MGRALKLQQGARGSVERTPSPDSLGPGPGAASGDVPAELDDADQLGDSRQALAALTDATGPAASVDSAVRTWFELHDPSRSPPLPPARAPSWVAALCATSGLLALAIARSVLVRALLPLALFAAAVVIVLRGRRKREPSIGHRRIGVDPAARALLFERSGHPPETLVSLAGPFGVTLLTSRAHDRVLAAISACDKIVFLTVPVHAASRAAHVSLLSRATAVGSEDLLVEPTAPDGERLEIELHSLAALVDQLVALDPGCLDRLVLSDPKGEPVVLDDGELRIRGVRFDLRAPLEWRPIVFQEPFGHAVAIYQGTYVSQGGAEAVLVSLLPSLAPDFAPSARDATGMPELDKLTARDARLAQATPEAPPVREQRVAIERLFMLPLRSAIDRAPRASVKAPRDASPAA